jgi:hypothetical protein
LGNLEARYHSEELGVDGMIILKWILGNSVGICMLDTSGSGQGSVKVLVNTVMNFRVP